MIYILQIGLNNNPGGIENCILNYHRFIDRSQFTFDYVDIYGKGLAYADEIVNLGGKIYSLPNYKRKPLFVLKELQLIFSQNKYDIIHINILSAANIIPILIAYRSKATIIVHSHNSSIPSGVLRKIMHKFNLKILQSLSVEKWACSLKAGKWMWGEEFLPQNVIPNAIDLEKFSRNICIRKKIRNKCGFKDTDVVIGFVGRFSEQKNVLFIPEILVELKRISANFKLLLVGDGVLKEKLIKKIKDLHIENEVFFAGIQTNVAEWYQAMDCFILPSLFEGLPIVGVEAQAAGLPCFVSNAITKDLNITGTVQFLPTNQGSNIWAKLIYEGLGKKIKNTWLNKYSIKFAAQELEKKYKKLFSEEGQERI